MPSIMALMSSFVDNRGDAAYSEVLAEMADRARAWQGPIVVVAHVDPDGDALGSSLALKRALERLGKKTILPLEPPRFLRFLALSSSARALPGARRWGSSPICTGQ